MIHNGLDPFFADRLDERSVALILVGLLDRELANRVIKESTRPP
jgi:hypothetical protein